ncbi:MAG: hypothetical protein HC812_01340 [Leptolyngbya sp. RL_3_1]|nr:hypothetical protein [Leptolyngbya sp. RL_3_1]
MTEPTPIAPSQYRIALGFAGFMAIGTYVPLVMGLVFLPSGIVFLMLMFRVKPAES